MHKVRRRVTPYVTLLEAQPGCWVGPPMFADFLRLCGVPEERVDERLAWFLEHAPDAAPPNEPRDWREDLANIKLKWTGEPVKM